VPAWNDAARLAEARAGVDAADLPRSTGSPADHLPCVLVRLLGPQWPPRFAFVGATATTILGLEPASLLIDGSVLTERMPREDSAELRRGLSDAFGRSGAWRAELRLWVRDVLRRFECRLNVMRDAAGESFADGYLAECPGTVESGDASDQLYQRAFKAAPQPMGVVDQQGRTLAVNDAFVREFGYSLNEVPTLDTFLRATLPDTGYRMRKLAQWEQNGKTFLASQLPQEPVVARHRCRDGIERIFEARTTWTPAESFVTFTDITERTAAEDRSRLWHSVLLCTAEGIMICNASGVIVAVNPAFEQITGYSERDVVGQTPRILHSGRQGRAFYANLWRSLLDTGHWSGEIWNRRKDGEVYAEWLALNAVRDAQGTVAHYVGIFSDITDHKAREERLRKLAHFDALTELPNRAHLLQRLERATEAAARDHTALAVMFLDLDRFKEINDSMGHDAGDTLLRTIAGRIRGTVRQADTVARMGGDEFVIVLESLRGAEDASHIAQALLSEASRPLMLGGQEVAVSASIGVSLYPEDGLGAGDLMRNADTAMYQAKHDGRNRFVFYTKDMNEHAVARLRLENELRQALERREFTLHYQPQIDLVSGAVVGVEALVRWNRPDRGLVPPGEFIPIAEECGLITGIGAWVLDEALRQVAIWEGQGIPGITIAVNASPIEFHEPGFVDRIARALEMHRVPAERLELEITEGVVMRDVEAAKRTLKQLHDMGIKLSIDDFGTGYSSLSYLRHFTVDKLKIDKSFIGDVTTDPRALQLVRAIIAFARSLGIRVNAEGVESRGQLAVLLREGCDEIQGFLASPGLATPECEALLRGWKAGDLSRDP
jgi:diguanylate cyclase (GGDEF)-like protein/PAS domain S-box-containing protein